MITPAARYPSTRLERSRWNTGATTTAAIRKISASERKSASCMGVSRLPRSRRRSAAARIAGRAAGARRVVYTRAGCHRPPR